MREECQWGAGISVVIRGKGAIGVPMGCQWGAIGKPVGFWEGAGGVPVEY